MHSAVAAPAAAEVSAQPQTATGPSSDGDQAGTKFVVTSLARGGESVTLKFTLANNSATPLLTYNRFNGAGFRGYRDMSGIHLIDTVSKKKYFVIADTETVCVCSHEVADIAPGAQVPLYAKFPALPAGVTKITVEAPHFIPLDGVPITQ